MTDEAVVRKDVISVADIVDSNQDGLFLLEPKPLQPTEPAHIIFRRMMAMKPILSIIGFPARVLFCSLLALACQIFLVVDYPDLLLTVQESIKQGSVYTFESVQMAAGYRVAYNLLNGDGILVHTLFVLMVLLALQLLFRLFRLPVVSRE